MKNFTLKTLSTIIVLGVITMIIVANSTHAAYKQVLTATATLDFANTAAGTATDLTVTVTGAVDGDPAIVGIPNASTVGNGAFVAWVSSDNTVTVRFLNNNLLTALNPASGSFKISVFK